MLINIEMAVFVWLKNLQISHELSYAHETAKQMIIKDLTFRENTQKENV